MNLKPFKGLKPKIHCYPLKKLKNQGIKKGDESIPKFSFTQNIPTQTAH